jgi:hypothetical protein
MVRSVRSWICAGVLVPLALAALVGGARALAAANPGSAAALLINRADLGRGWTVSAAAPTPVPALTCHTLPAALRRDASRRAASPTYAFGSAELVGEGAYRYASPAIAGAVWGQVAQTSLLSCLAQSLERSAGHGVTFSVTGRRVISAPHLSVHARAYRVLATATYQGQPYPAYLDELVLSLPGAVAELTFATFESAPSSALEARVARIAVRRGAHTTG